MIEEHDAWLSFALTPVQGFISAARTVRDLAVGSKILNSMVAAAIEAGLAAGGKLLFPEQDSSQDRTSLPNRFVMTFRDRPTAEQASDAARARATYIWTLLANDTDSILTHECNWGTGWNADWQEQIDGYWAIQTNIVCRSEDLENSFTKLYGRSDHSVLEMHWAVLAAAYDASKQVRNYVSDHGVGRQTCSLMGEFEQMGPDAVPGIHADWWRQHARTRYRIARVGENERLCAVALVKRFAPVCRSASAELKSCAESVKDTATLAANGWIRLVSEYRPEIWNSFETACRRLNGSINDSDAAESTARFLLEDRITARQLEKEYGTLNDQSIRLLADLNATKSTLLMTARELQVPLSRLMPTGKQEGDVRTVSLGPPPRYLAAIAMDGDKIGERLSRLSDVRDFAQISKMLLDFSKKSETIVTDHAGQHIYAGGDDLLALTHSYACMPCTSNLHDAFPKLLAGSSEASTISTGLVIFHYKYDLRAAIKQAKQAESEAKSDGRNRVGLRVLKRSGGDAQVTARYEDLDQISILSKQFRAGEGFGWLKALNELAPALNHGTRAMIGPQIRALLGHADGLTDDAMQTIEGLLQNCARTGSDGYGESGRTPFRRFMLFMSVAAFLARGRGQ